MQKQTTATSATSFSWMDDEGLHLMEPGTPHSPEQLKKMTEEYQKRIRKLQVRVFCFIPRSSERLPRGISKQIRRFAMGIVNGMEIDDLDGGVAVCEREYFR